MTLVAIQRGLEQLYRLPQSPDVSHFLLSEEHREAIGDEHRSAPEQLFVAHDEEDVLLGLYFSEEVGDTNGKLHAHLHPGSSAFGRAMYLLEGVSHFVMAAWCAGQDRRITGLELELQAEIDKFVTSYLEMGMSNPVSLLARLFDDFDYLPQLTSDELARYECANDFGRQYAASLSQRYQSPSDAPAMFGELREFYRRPLEQKLELISRA